MVLLSLCATGAVGGLVVGCKKDPPPAVTHTPASPGDEPAATPDERAAVKPPVRRPVRRRDAEPSTPLPRFALGIPDGAGHAGFDVAPDDDPELLDDYYGGLPEEDGGAVTQKAPPRPTGLPGNRSFSIGPPNAGWLMGGKPMPLRGRHHRVLSGTERRHWNWATDRLIELLLDASTAVGERHGGAPLRIGNLSKQEGGKITPSVSHQSGRDADIGIYATDLDGNSVDAPGFPKFDGHRGLLDTTGRFLFDVKRNWAFVEALLSSEKARIQWIFLDDPLKEALLDYAVRTQASTEAIARAEKVIVRPRNSSPHANHYHIRIFCTDGDLEFGCRDYGPEWDWVKQERAEDRAHLESRIDSIVDGEIMLDLSDGTPHLQGSVPPIPDDANTAGSPVIRINGRDVLPTEPAPKRQPDGGANSPDQLPDPPVHVPIKL